MTGRRTRLKLVIAGAILLVAGLLWLRSASGPRTEPGAGEPAGAAPGRIDRLSWLAGCWKHEETGYRRDEQWMRPAGGTMIGMSRTVADGETVEWEHLRVEESEGRLVYIASPAGQAVTSFVEAELTGSSAAFEAPEHDFPQRIVYERLAPGSIHAWIEGEVDGLSRVVEFPLARTRCP